MSPRCEIDAGGARLWLLPQRAGYLPDAGLLLVADAHFGKAQAFRRLGVPVPGGTTAATLARLDAALEAATAGAAVSAGAASDETGVPAAAGAPGLTGIVFLGDLLHSVHGRSQATLAQVARWRAAHPALSLTLVRGNHDGHAGDPPADWQVDCVDGPLRVGPLALTHTPSAVPGAYVLAGHVHPAATISGCARERLRLPCFHFGPEVGVLPAFGDFTGLHVLPRAAGDRVFVIADDRVCELR